MGSRYNRATAWVGRASARTSKTRASATTLLASYYNFIHIIHHKAKGTYYSAIVLCNGISTSTTLGDQQILFITILMSVTSDNYHEKRDATSVFLFQTLLIFMYLYFDIFFSLSSYVIRKFYYDYHG